METISCILSTVTIIIRMLFPLTSDIRNLDTNNLQVWKYSNSATLNRTLNLSKGATVIAVCPNSHEWQNTYFAIGLCSGTIQVYNSDFKIIYRTAHTKSNILSLAYSSQVWSTVQWTCHLWDGPYLQSYRIPQIFRVGKISWFSRFTDHPRNFYPRR